jgi:hypothetical protein
MNIANLHNNNMEPCSPWRETNDLSISGYIPPPFYGTWSCTTVCCPEQPITEHCHESVEPSSYLHIYVLLL